MRLSRLATDAASENIRPQLEEFYRRRGNVPNMFRTAAHRPELLRTLLAHYHAVMEKGTVAPRLKELLAVRVSQLNACDY